MVGVGGGFAWDISLDSGSLWQGSQTLVNPRFDRVFAVFKGLTLEYMAPLRTRPLRIQMMEAAGLALSAWQVRLRWSPARRLTTGEPTITGSSGGTAGKGKERRALQEGRNAS